MVRVRVLTALALAAALLLAVFVTSPVGWGIFVAAVVALAAREWFGLLGVTGNGAVLWACLVALPSLVSGWAVNTEWWRAVAQLGYASTAAFWVFIVPFVLRFRPSLQGVFWRYVAGFVVILPASFALVELRSADPWILIAAMAPVWVADIAAFFVGRKFGRNKLAPNISPGKSWEGVIGAIVGVVVYGVLVRQFVPAFSASLSLHAVVVFALFITAMGVIGDLFESLMKRQAGVKDSGTLLPGHGGVLDRVDSLLSTLPFAAVMLMLYRFAN